MESPQKPDTPVLIYPRRRRGFSGMFAGWFVTIGSINLLLSALTLALGVIIPWMSIADWQKGARWMSQFPFVELVMSGFMLLVGGLVFAGSLGSLWRASWSLKLVRAGLAGEVTVAGVNTLLLFLHQQSIAGAWLLCVMVAYTGYLAFALYLYSSLRAHFYFGPEVLNAADAGITLPLNMPGNGVAAARAFTFRISGIDKTTGQPVRISSRAKTATLARKSAVMLGMTSESIQVQPLDDSGSKAPQS